MKQQKINYSYTPIMMQKILHVLIVNVDEKVEELGLSYGCWV
jgi:hypothetical protein